VQARRLLHADIARALAQYDVSTANPTRSLDALIHFERAELHSEIPAALLTTATRLLERGMPTHAAAALRRHSPPSAWRVDALADLLEESLYRAGDYSGLLSILGNQDKPSSTVRLRDTLSPESTIRRIEAASHSDTLSDTRELAAHAILIAEMRSCAAETRLTAATLALRIVANGLDRELAERAYRAGHSVLRVASVGERQELEFELIYHTSFGDLEAAATAVRRLAVLLPTMQTGNSRVSTTLNTAYCFRVCGEMDASNRLFEQAHSEALGLGMTTAAVLSAWYASIIADDAYADEPGAWHWMERAIEARGDSNDPLLRLVIDHHMARLLVASETRYDRNQAEALLVPSVAERQFPKREAYATAIRLALSLRENERSDTEALMEHGMDLFTIVKSTLGQDYLATQLIRALRLLGREAEATTLSSNYVSAWRREKYLLPHYFRTAIEQHD
jgi:hypothetical protein